MKRRTSDLQNRLKVAEDDCATTQEQFESLKSERNNFLAGHIPGYTSIGASLGDRILQARQDELGRLEELAGRRWPKREVFERATDELHAKWQVLDRLREELSRDSEELRDLSNFIERNRAGLDIDAENELIHDVADALRRGVDEFELLQLIYARGQNDAVTILARSRLYLANVLLPKLGRG